MAKRIVDPRRIKLARGLRRKQTPAETKLWNSLRSLETGRSRFRRQHPIGDYVVDFVNLERKLIVELDGGQHNYEQGKKADAQRTEWLEKEGYRVIRFWNNDILTNIDGVCLAIMEALR